MGDSVVIHGFVTCPFDFGHNVESWRVFEHNRFVISSLPTIDSDSPGIVRSMFAVHPPKRTEPYYDTHLITFGAAYKNMYLFEGRWVQKFEELLSRLCWNEADVFNEFHGLHCNWQAEQAHERAFADPPSPPLKWSNKYFRVTEQQIPFSDAVDDTGPARKK